MTEKTEHLRLTGHKGWPSGLLLGETLLEEQLPHFRGEETEAQRRPAAQGHTLSTNLQILDASWA